MRKYFALLTLGAALVLSNPADPLSRRVSRRLDLIQSGKARPGTVLTFSSAELNAWVREKAPAAAPQGLRNPRIEIGRGSVTGRALVDLLKLRNGAGQTTNWLLAKLIEGEKPLTVNVRIESARGRATVLLRRVEIGGIAVSGRTLDLLIDTFFTPLYPNAKINRPFDLEDGVERIEAAPSEARVYIRK